MSRVNSSIVMPNCYCQGTLFYRIGQIIGQIVARLAAALVAATIVACATPEQYAQTLARGHGPVRLLLRGTQVQHPAFAPVRGAPGLLVLFIEGDGSPWVRGGRRIAADPTQHAPLCRARVVLPAPS